MRDGFDHYFRGWTLDADEFDADKADFEALVAAVGRHVTEDPVAAEAWRVFPFDGKKALFFHFLKHTRDAGALPPSSAPLMDRLTSAYPRSLG